MAQNWLRVGNGDQDRIRSAEDLIAVLLGRACQLNASIEPPALTESVTGTDLIQDNACDRTVAALAESDEERERRRDTFETYMNPDIKCICISFHYYHMHIINLFLQDH